MLKEILRGFPKGGQQIVIKNMLCQIKAVRKYEIVLVIEIMIIQRLLQIIATINHMLKAPKAHPLQTATNSTLCLIQQDLEKLQITLLSTGKQLGILATQEC